jgi:hypothetical protein
MKTNNWAMQCFVFKYIKMVGRKSISWYNRYWISEFNIILDTWLQFFVDQYSFLRTDIVINPFQKKERREFISKSHIHTHIYNSNSDSIFRYRPFQLKCFQHNKCTYCKGYITRVRVVVVHAYVNLPLCWRTSNQRGRDDLNQRFYFFWVLNSCIAMAHILNKVHLVLYWEYMILVVQVSIFIR